MSLEGPGPPWWDDDQETRAKARASARSIAHARLHRQRLTALVALVGLVSFGVALVAFRIESEPPGKKLSAATHRSPRPTAASAVSTVHLSPASSASARPKVAIFPKDGGWLGDVRLTGGFRVVEDPIPFGAKRREETAQYSLRHYGQDTWRLTPHVIVLHFTDGSSYEGAHQLFASDTPNLGELPGDTSHFIIDTNGTIYQQLSTQIRGRHAIGVNWVAIGIEFVQPQGASSHWADQQI